MNPKLETAQHKFIESIGKLCASFGLNKLVAQIYALLYLSDRALSLDEIAQRLKVSKASVSMNIRELEGWGAVRSVWVKGSRKDYYEAELDVKKVVVNKLKTSIQKRVTEISSMTDQLNGIVRSDSPEFTEEDKATAAIYGERLKKIEELKSIASTALTLADKLL